MYAALWRALPGPVALKAAAMIVLLALVVWACFEWVFPLVVQWLPYDDNTVTLPNLPSSPHHPDLQDLA
ncbi:hypothetical protein [Knoellia subterranea]|uniref:Membrane protein n=1 Tax=Knoellia subterranea KCTC 19937 TaxID=1385521 RepID=A0A0A0JL52_9MICO|nr:hypothetical protein [Knoellia subterranea]KGN37464.1 membrane protein [Knoellia subterranea KCTC 19937]